jgi:hypothetical protein
LLGVPVGDVVGELVGVSVAAVTVKVAESECVLSVPVTVKSPVEAPPGMTKVHPLTMLPPEFAVQVVTVPVPLNEIVTVLPES